MFKINLDIIATFSACCIVFIVTLVVTHFIMNLTDLYFSRVKARDRKKAKINEIFNNGTILNKN